MRSGGELRPHMYEHSRLNGAVYINVPDKNQTDKGNFVVCVDEDYVRKIEALFLIKLLGIFRKSHDFSVPSLELNHSIHIP